MDLVAAPPAALAVAIEGNRATLRLSGVLDLASTSALWGSLDTELERTAAGEAVIDVSGLESCDSAGIALLLYVQRRLGERQISSQIEGANDQVASLLALVGREDHPVTDPLPFREHPGAVVRVGRFALDVARHVRQTLIYIGSICGGLLEAVVHPRRVRWWDTLDYMARNGADALGIVALINFLMGVILAFQMADQLHKYGADIYLADVIGLSIVMELGPLMTAIVLSGRSGAAFAAEIGTMTVNEEVDALDTMGLDRTRFLVMPKMIALLLAMPLLVTFANICGITGGIVIGVGSVGLPLKTYLVRTQEAIHLWDATQGFIKGQAYAIVIAAVGCLRGLQTRTGAQGVGRSTTSAVVSGIFLIIVVDALLTLVFRYV